MDDVTNATGSAKQMYDVYSQSLEARIADLKRAFEGLYEKMLSSDSLKWLVTEFTQLVTALSSVDGKTIAFTATVGGLILVMSKLSALNKTLIAEEAVTGLSKFIALASGMSVVGEATTGVGTAFGFLGNSIKGATASAIGFMATPIGAIITAIGSVLLIAVSGFVAYKQHQEELTQQSKELREALEGVNTALANGDTKTASMTADKMRQEQKALTDLINKRKELESSPEPNTSDYYKSMGGADKAQSIALVTQKIDEQIKVIKNAGLSVDETTGKIQELQQAESQIVNQNIVDKIKEETKAQVEHRSNIEANTQEYNNYISTVKDLYSQYQTLSSEENLSSEQKQQLASVVEQLQGKIGNLDVQMDANGKTYITNTGLISDTISYLDSEGQTVETLTQIKLADEKSNAQWQYNNTSITYAQTVQRIAYYQNEIAEIQKLMEARLTEASQVISHKDDLGNYDTSDDKINETEHLYAIQKRNSQARIDSANEEINKLKAGKDAIDKLYNSMVVPSGGGAGLKAPSGGSYMPSGGGAGSKGKEAKDYTDEIAKMQAKFDPDPYFELNNAIKGVDNELTVNKTLLDSLTEGSPEYQQAQLKQIEIEKKKQIALQNLNDEQKKQSNILKDYLTQYGFTFDEIGNITNSQDQIKYWADITDAMAGSSEEDKAKKQEWIDWIKELQDKTKDYSDLVNDKIPSVANQWSEVGNEIKKSNEEMKKANQEILDNAKEELAQGILKEAQDEVDALKAQAEQLREDAKNSLEEEKESELALWDEKIKSKQAELDALNDESENNEEKLKKIQAELALWKRETDNPFAKSKIESLTTQQDELIKTIKKDTLSKEIDSLNSQKQEESDYYDKQLSDLEKANKEQEAEDEEHYKQMLNSKEAYAKAEKMITKNQQSEMYKILSKYSDEYKKMGGDVATSVEASLKKIADAITNLNNAKIKDFGGSSVKYTGTSSSGSNYAVIKGGIVADSPFDINEANQIYDSSSSGKSSSSSKTSTNANKTYANGDYTDSKGNYYTNSGNTYYDEASKSYKKYGSYATGGRTPSNIDNGALAVLHSDEKILNQKDTVMIDQIYDFVKSSGSLINQLAQSYSNSSNYSIPNLSINDLNKIANSVINNDNSSNNISTPVEMSVSIINQNGAEAVMNEKTLEKMVTKVVQKNATKYGGKGFTNR